MGTQKNHQHLDTQLSHLREMAKKHIAFICSELAANRNIIIYEVEEEEMVLSTGNSTFNLKGFTYFANTKEVLVRVENKADQRTDTWTLDSVEIQDLILLIQWHEDGLLHSKPV